MLRAFVVFFLFFAIICSPSFSQTLGDLVLKEGVGVRALGMGGAQSAIANDASALFYNPAALAEPGFALTFGSLDAQQVNNDYNFSLLKLAYLGYGEAAVNNPGGNQFGVKALGFGNRNGWLNWGINYKSQEWKTAGVPERGWTSDIGFLLRLTPQLKMGLVAQDILTTKDRAVPASARLGLGFKAFDGQLLLAADGELYRDLTSYGHFGAEASLVRGLSLRGGVDRGTPTAGLSLNFSVVSFDYAVSFPKDNKNIQRFEAGVKFLPERERPFSVIKPREFVLIDIRGAIKGGLSEYSFLGGVHPGLETILENIRAAEKDRSVDGIFIRLGGFDGGLGGAAVVQEIRAELQRARQKGKKIVAYVEGSAMGDEYYLASAADKIIAAPGSFIGGFGRSLAIYRFSGLFEKLGIDWQVLARGKYKTSFDWLCADFSKEQKEKIEGLVGNIYRRMLTDIAASRKMKIEKVKEIGDGMVFPSGLSQKMGLIDKVGYLHDAARAAGELYNSEEEVKLIEPRLVENEEVFFAQLFGVAVVEVDGEITSGSGGQNLIFGGTFTGSDRVVKNIRQAADDMTVKFIVLRIDSPGGSSVAAGEIYQALQYAREKKKIIIASLGSVAASGGYYIAAGADKIVADPSTITGSIGVISFSPVFSELMKKVGVKANVVKEGSHSDMFSGLRKFTSVEAAALERIMDETYNDFVNAVSSGRKLPTKEVEALAQGIIYTGEQALEVKLVDKLGGFSDAIDLGKQEAKLTGDPRFIYYRDFNPFQQMGEKVNSSLGMNYFDPLLYMPLLKKKYN